MRKNKVTYPIVAMILIANTALYGQPTDPQIISGEVTFETSGSSLLITGSDKAIIHWNDFSIGNGEVTQFVLPDVKAAVLNRVTSETMSQLMGQLQSNGQVYLINPNGILIGANAIIDTASFIASTLDIANDNFFQNTELLFQGKSQQAIVNLGVINAKEGDIVLIGYKVENQGQLNAPNGLAGLAAGQEVLLKPPGQERIFIRTPVPQSVTKDPNGGVEHSGMIQALEAEIKADGNLYARAINYIGVAEANGVVEKNGRILLISENGKTEFSGQAIAHNADGTGGEVHILSEEVVLYGHSLVDVSGGKGGGTILVGGNYQGKETPGPNALKTAVGRNAQLKANASASGNGGRVIVWADDSTFFHGNIYAQGGSKSGDGGFVEVSGKETLTFLGQANTIAPKGKTGMLLLDPADLTIGGNANVGDIIYLPGACGASCEEIMVNTCGAPYTVATNTAPSNLVASLGTTNVQVIAGQDSCTGTGSITVTDPITWNSAFGLTLSASGDIRIENPITAQGDFVSAGAGPSSADVITLTTSGGIIVVGSPITALMGNITINNTNTSLTPSDTAISINNSITTTSIVSPATYSDISIMASTGNIIIGDPSASPTPSGPIEISSVGSPANTAGQGLGAAQINITASGGSLTVQATEPSSSAQIGFGSVNSSIDSVVTCDINIDLNANTVNGAGDISIVNSSAVVFGQIGHGGGTTATTLNGDINVTLTGDTSLSPGGDNGFAHIGHRPNPGADTTIGGIITFQAQNGSIADAGGMTLTAGSGSIDSYALIGFGGTNSTGTTTYRAYRPQNFIFLIINHGIHTEFLRGTINLTGSQTGAAADQCYAAMGYTGNPNVIFHDQPNINLNFTLPVNVQTGPPFTMTLQGGNSTSTSSGAYIGYFFYLPPPGAVNPQIGLPAAPNDTPILSCLGDIYNYVLEGGTGASSAAMGIDTFKQSGVNVGGDVGILFGLGTGISVGLTDGNITFNAQGSTNTPGGAFTQDGIGNPLNHPRTSDVSGTNTLTIQSSASSAAGIKGTGSIFVDAGISISLIGTSTFPAYINAFQDSPPNIFSTLFPTSTIITFEGNISLQDFAQINQTGPGTITVYAAQNVSLANNSSIRGSLANSNVTVVVDGIYNSPSVGIGPGQFMNDSTSFLLSGSHAQLRVYTARFHQNTQDGLLNTLPFTGTYRVDDTFNEYSTYWSGGTYISNYRVYYKEPGTKEIMAAIVSSFQGLPDLFLYDEMYWWGKEFTVSYEPKSFKRSLLGVVRNWIKNTMTLEGIGYRVTKGINPMDSYPNTEAVLSSYQLLEKEYYLLMMKKNLLNQDPY